MNVNENLDRIGKAMQAAWSRVKKAQSRMWGEWMTIGEGLLEGRNWAMQVSGVNRPEGRGYVTAYAEWLRRYRVDDMDKSEPGEAAATDGGTSGRRGVAGNVDRL